MAIEVFNRYEHKYLLNKSIFEQVVSVMDEKMMHDEYNKNNNVYTIANIYYDTPDDYLIRNSISKPEYKEKLRLRCYGLPDMDSKVFLEIKKKYKGLVNKRRTKIYLKDSYEFIKTGVAPDIADFMNCQIVNEIAYFLKIYKPVPKLYLAYDRIAYFGKDNLDLRISFDMNIRSRRHDLGLEYGNYGDKLLGDDVYLMEVKTSMSKPMWLCNLLTDLHIYRTSFSKYGTEYIDYTKNRQIV